MNQVTHEVVQNYLIEPVYELDNFFQINLLCSCSFFKNILFILWILTKKIIIVDYFQLNIYFL